MSNHSYEIEIKSLLGDRAKAEELINKMQQLDPNFQVKGQHSQLNHYFTGTGSLSRLQEKLNQYLDEAALIKLQDIVSKAKDYSLRTRLADQTLLLVIKASIDDTSSSNGTARLEFETQIKGLTIEELDQIILDCGFQYQAKWSRKRSDYNYRGLNVSIDRNAGYGYLAEFEQVESDPEKADEVKANLRSIMRELGAEELDQERLARMFDYYNTHWQEYYGTEKTFVID
jgi:predicted adenylyl cyclase CyaB